MNGERFDGLTRALANGQVSRGRVLKMVAAAAVGGTLGGWGSLLRSEGANAKKIPKAQKECRKTCGGGVGACTTTGKCCTDLEGLQIPCGSICFDPAEAVCCDGRLPDLSIDRNHCGRCGHACPSTQICYNGNCVAACTRDGVACQSFPPHCEFCEATTNHCMQIRCPTGLVLDPTGNSCVCTCPNATDEFCFNRDRPPGTPESGALCCSQSSCTKCNYTTGQCEPMGCGGQCSGTCPQELGGTCYQLANPDMIAYGCCSSERAILHPDNGRLLGCCPATHVAVKNGTCCLSELACGTGPPFDNCCRFRECCQDNGFCAC
jgi:hypothetical protein